MKILELHNYLKIEKETENAVAVKPRLLTDEDLKRAELLFWEVGTQVKNGLFWLPKSQIQIENNQVTGVTRWLEKKNFIFYDSPIFLEKDFLELKKENKNETSRM